MRKAQIASILALLTLIGVLIYFGPSAEKEAKAVAIAEARKAELQVPADVKPVARRVNYWKPDTFIVEYAWVANWTDTHQEVEFNGTEFVTTGKYVTEEVVVPRKRELILDVATGESWIFTYSF